MGARVAVALRNAKAAKKDAKSAVEVLDGELKRAPLLSPHPHTTNDTATKGSDGNKSVENSLQEAMQNQRSAMAMVLKAYLEYSKGNVRKALKLLTQVQFNFAES